MGCSVKKCKRSFFDDDQVRSFSEVNMYYFINKTTWFIFLLMKFVIMAFL